MSNLTFQERRALADAAARRLKERAQAFIDVNAQTKWRRSLLTQARLKRVAASNKAVG